MPTPSDPLPEPNNQPRPEHPSEPLGGQPPSVSGGHGIAPIPAAVSGKPREGEVDWAWIVARAGSYPRAAFDFVRDGLGHTVERALLQQEHALRAGMGNPGSHHVSGQQLCIGLRDYAILQYGMLAPAVLRHWNIVRTEDFGRIVYAMIEGGLMSKTADDSIDDFAAVYDFDEAFSDAHLSQRIGG